MPNINRIVGYVPMSEILKDPKRYARQFSRGNVNLYNLLLHCWALGLETLSCCPGIYAEDFDPLVDGIDSHSHIMLYVPYKKRGIIYNILKIAYRVHGAVITIGKDYNRNDILINIKSVLNRGAIFEIADGALYGETENIINSKDNSNHFYNEEPISAENMEEIIKIVELVNGLCPGSWEFRFNIINSGGIITREISANAVKIKKDGTVSKSLIELGKILNSSDIKKMNAFFETENSVPANQVSSKQLIR